MSLRSDDLNSVGERYIQDNFGQLVVTIKTTPGFLGGLGELDVFGDGNAMSRYQYFAVLSAVISELAPCLGNEASRIVDSVFKRRL